MTKQSTLLQLVFLLLRKSHLIMNSKNQFPSQQKISENSRPSVSGTVPAAFPMVEDDTFTFHKRDLWYIQLSILEQG